MLRKLQRYDEAIAAYRQALQLQPQDATAWFGQGLAQARLKHYEEAIAAYDRALEIQPDYAQAWCDRGAALGI